MLAAYATLQACLLVRLLRSAAATTLSSTGNTDNRPNGRCWRFSRLALPLMALVGWLVSRLASGRDPRGASRPQRWPSWSACAIIECRPGPTDRRKPSSWAAVLILTGCGVGSVRRLGGAHDAVASVDGRHAGGPGPAVVLLTALVFFNTYVWLMAATINGQRLGLAMAFLVGIAAAFVVSTTRGTGQADAAIDDGVPARRQRKPYRHTVCDDAGRRRRRPAEANRNASTWSSCWPPRNWRRSWWWRWSPPRST